MQRQLIIGGGCFWCTEAVFRELQGVFDVKSGYSGGQVAKPTYREVTSGMTGHAEVVQVTYDPSQIAYADLLKIHLTTHDPTTLNRQGADVGTQYRSIIFFQNEEEQAAALAVIEEVQAAFDKKIVTEVKQFETFYEAEAYHQDYYANNPLQGYCMAVINPKLRKFKKLYADRLKAQV